MIVFDTAPVIWGVQKHAAPGFESMILRTAAYIRHLSHMGERVIIPAPVVGEYLLKFNEVERLEQLRRIERSFRVAAFDLKAAFIAAELEHNQELIKQIRNTNRVGRDQLRIDTQIVAIAISLRADFVVTGNLSHLLAVAQGRIPVIEVPVIHEQMELPFGASTAS